MKARPPRPHLTVVALLLLAACRDDLQAPEASQAPGATPSVATPAPLAPATTLVTSALTLPASFDGTTILNDGPSVPSPVQGPTKMAIAIDGRIFIAEHFGGVRIVKNDAVVPTPFLTIPDANIDHSGSRGLMGIVLDPAFATNGYLYLHYTRKVSATVSRNRISRFRASAGNLDRAEVDGSGNPIETLIYEMSNQGSSGAHNSMPMAFGGDGKLYVATGENSVPANAQNSTHTAGKLLRLNADGSPATGNPLFASSNQVEKRLWAKGLRNPWTLARDPASNRIFIGDVGSLEGGTPDSTNQPWEECNSVPETTTTLLDYGWPNNEGRGPNLVHRYANGPGEDGSDCAMVGGAFYRSTGATHSFPATYAGVYFFGDHCSGYIRYLPTSQQTPAASIPTTTSTGFATGLGAALLDLQVHPDGSLYYIARATVVRDHDAPGVIGRIRPTSVPVPTVSITSPLDGDALAAPASLVVTASAAHSSGITKVEFFSNGMKLGEDASPPYQQGMNDLPQGQYRLTARATNTVGGVKESDAVTVVVGGPTASIALPDPGSSYVAGQALIFSGSGSDLEDGPLPASALEWNVLLHHNSHTHPAAGPIAGVASGTFTPHPDDETDHDVFYAIYLTVTDSAGLRHTARRDVFPIKSTITVTTSPAGLKVNLDGSPQTGPHSFLGAAGVNRSLEAPYYQVAANGNFYEWLSWSQGGPKSQTISTPSNPATYTASYLQQAWSTADIGAVGATGSFSLSGTGVFTLRGAGADFYGTADEFRYTWRTITGDASITARVTGLDNKNTWSKAAVMMRASNAANAANVAALLSPTATNKYRLQVRPTSGASTTSTASAANSAIPSYLRLTRTGNDFRAFHSSDNITFTQVGTTQTLTGMPATILVGLAMTSHVDTTAGLGNALFDSVVISGAGPTPVAPPGAPTGLTATPGDAQAALSWTAVGDATSYTVKRATTSGGPYSNVQTGVTSTSFTNTGLTNGTTYFYVVSASNGAGEGVISAQASVTPSAPPPPGAPGGLVATAGNAQISLGWSAVSGATSYTVKRATTSGGPYSNVQTGVTSTSFTNTGLTNGTTYFYVVSASNGSGEGANSGQASATPTLPPPPAAPTGLAATAGNAQVSLSWSAVSGATSYTVKRATTSGGPYSNVQTGVTSTNFTNTGLTNGTTYFYVVTATGVGGESGPSAQVSATPVAAPLWSSQDVGAVGAAGSFSEAGGTFTVVGSGADIWGTADEFRFVHRTLTGNGTLIARVASIQASSDPLNKVGIMMREGPLTSAGARNVAMVTSQTASNQYRLQVRSTAGGSTTKTQAAAVGTGAAPIWFRLVRSGNTFSGSYSINGTSWTTMGSATIAMPAAIQVGLVVTSHLDGQLATGTFTSVSLQ